VHSKKAKRGDGKERDGEGSEEEIDGPMREKEKALLKGTRISVSGLNGRKWICRRP
jgi:hypothetical protein